MVLDFNNIHRKWSNRRTPANPKFLTPQLPEREFSSNGTVPKVGLKKKKFSIVNFFVITFLGVNLCFLNNIYQF